MFGTYRTVLALCVVLHHYFNWQPLGEFAVHCFFALSGFLMTLLVCETYRGRPMAFFLNRFLRLYPSYWTVCVLTAAFILLRPMPQMVDSGSDMGLPTAPNEIFAQLAIMVRSHGTNMMVPIIWAVTNELFYYLLIGFGVTLTARRSAACVAVSIVVVAASLVFDRSRIYFSIAGASLPFALGGLVYHLAKTARARKAFADPIVQVTVSAAACALFFCSSTVFENNVEAGYRIMVPIYAAVLLSLPLIFSLYSLPVNLPAASADGALGRLSYPLYLSHFLALLVTQSVPPYLTGLSLKLVAVVCTILISVTLAFLVDAQVERLRKLVRARGHNHDTDLSVVDPSSIRYPAGLGSTARLQRSSTN